jgi:hypothetical protein
MILLNNLFQPERQYFNLNLITLIKIIFEKLIYCNNSRRYLEVLQSAVFSVVRVIKIK